MTGIAGGMKGVANFGDVVAADVVWDYSSGKMLRKKGADEFSPEPRVIDIDAKVKGQLMRLVSVPGLLTRISQDFDGTKPVGELKVVFGPMFTGSAVIANAAFAKSLNEMHRKVKGIDMEAYAVACAAKYSAGVKPVAIVLKSVSDFADAKKNDDYHAYAAYTSATLLHEWAIRYL